MAGRRGVVGVPRAYVSISSFQQRCRRQRLSRIVVRRAIGVLVVARPVGAAVERMSWVSTQRGRRPTSSSGNPCCQTSRCVCRSCCPIELSVNRRRFGRVCGAGLGAMRNCCLTHLGVGPTGHDLVIAGRGGACVRSTVNLSRKTQSSGME